MKNESIKIAIGYIRVSTKGQGKKGYGLLAQKRDLSEFERKTGITLVRIYSEIGSGKSTDRPILKKAVSEAKKADAYLVVPKIDRLSRKLWHLAYLIETGLKVLTAEIPFAPKFVLYILGIFAELEGDAISERTRKGMSAASDKGVKFGTGVEKTHKQQRKAYQSFASGIKPTIAKLYATGFTSVHQLKEILNKKKIKTFRGGGKRWHNTTVHRLLKELKYL